MKNLNPLLSQPSYIDRYIAIRDKKRTPIKNQLINAHDQIHDRYRELANSIATETLQQMRTDQRMRFYETALRACYDGATKPLKELKKAIKDAQPKRQMKYCPMCETTLPSTFDHYLPAVHFPEFSVHPLNLVPCCATCNSKKGDDWLACTGKRQYLHAFIDVVPATPFLEVSLYEDTHLAGFGATFQLCRPQGVTDELWALIESHFAQLGLLERYNEQSNVEIAEMLSNCYAYLEAGGIDAQQFLKQLAYKHEIVHGPSYWRAVLMQALADQGNLYECLISGAVQNKS